MHITSDILILKLDMHYNKSNTELYLINTELRVNVLSDQEVFQKGNHIAF